MKDPVVLNGICHMFFEQGLESIYWSFWDSKYIFPPSLDWPHGRFDFKGLWTLKDGDHLTIFDRKTGKKVIWSGFVSLWFNKAGKANQRGIRAKKWARWFKKEYPAQFTPGPNQNKVTNEI